MACCQTFAKIILIIFNIMFFLIGAIILGIGIWLKVDKSNLFEMMRKVNLGNEAAAFSHSGTSALDILAIVLIVIGTFTFVTGFCGCCGAMKESHCLLYIYSGLVGIVVIAEIGIGIYAGVENKKFNTQLSTALLKMLRSEFNDIIMANSTIFARAFTALMVELKCCGINGKTDFDKSSDWKIEWRSTENGKTQVNPVGCCPMKDSFKYDPSKTVPYSEFTSHFSDQSCAYSDTAATNQNGCVDTIINLIKKYLAVVIGVCVGLGLLEIMCIVFACCLIRKEE